MHTLRHLFAKQLQEILDVENQIINTVPNIIQQAEDKKLRGAIERQIRETKEQKKRVEKILSSLPDTVTSYSAYENPSRAIEGLIREASESFRLTNSTVVKEVGLIGALQAIEHFEISSYGTLVAYAKLLELGDAEKLLKQSLNEEYSGNKVLTKVAQGGFFTTGLNKQAAVGARAQLKQQLVALLLRIWETKHQLHEAFADWSLSATTQELKEAFNECLEETRDQIYNLKQIFSELNVVPQHPVHSSPLATVIEAVHGIREQKGNSVVMDCALIAESQKIHHVLLSQFTTAAAFAKVVDLSNIAKKLSQMADQEAHADKRLNQVAEGGLFRKGLNQIALTQPSSPFAERRGTSTSSRRPESAQEEDLELMQYGRAVGASKTEQAVAQRNLRNGLDKKEEKRK